MNRSRPLCRLLSVGFTACLVLCAGGCDPAPKREVEIIETRTVRRSLELGLSTKERFSLQRADAAHAGAARDPVFTYELPDGWVAQPASKFRLLSFSAPGGGDCSVSLASGTLPENVNRWRQQFGQPPLPDAEIAALPKHVVARRSSGWLVEIEGAYRGMGDRDVPDGKLIGLITPISDTRSLFLKLVGPRQAVEAQREAFLALAASLQVAEDPSARPDPAETVPPTQPVAWDVPAGWQVVPGASSMRLVTFAPTDVQTDAATGQPTVQCWVVVLPGEAGGLVWNINRWLGEVQQPAIDAAGVAALPTVEMFGMAAPLVEAFGDYRGQNGEVTEGGVLGVVAPRATDTVFVKLVGPADAVRAQKARFVEFCKSLRS